MFMDEIIQSYFNFKNTIFKDLIAQLIEVIFNIILVFYLERKTSFKLLIDLSTESILDMFMENDFGSCYWNHLIQTADCNISRGL